MAHLYSGTNPGRVPSQDFIDIARPNIPFIIDVFDVPMKTVFFWLVVLTILKNISQREGLSHILWKIKNV